MSGFTVNTRFRALVPSESSNEILASITFLLIFFIYILFIFLNPIIPTMHYNENSDWLVNTELRRRCLHTVVTLVLQKIHYYTVWSDS
jgi:uncharacterized membrane protein (DUF485 family)